MNDLAIGLLCGLVPGVAIIVFFIVAYYVYKKRANRNISNDLEAQEITPSTNVPSTNGRFSSGSSNTFHGISNAAFQSEGKRTPAPTKRPFQGDRRDSKSAKRRSLSQSENEQSVDVDAISRNLTFLHLTDTDYSRRRPINENVGIVIQPSGNEEAIFPQQNRNDIDITAEEVRIRRQINRERRNNNLNFVRQRELDCVLVIGADATPNVVGGYCVNLQENYCETYSLAITQVPWKLVNPKDTSEFEMKNLMFATMLWQEEIQKYRKFRIYTDNSAITSNNNKFGRVAKKLLTHCTNCSSRNVRRINKNVYCNRGRELSEFRTFIQPADDLSRGNQNDCELFIQDYYGIPTENFRRSFMPGDRNQMNMEFLQKANSAVTQWKVPCGKCGYSYRLGALRFIQASNWKNTRKRRNRRH